MNGTGRLFHRLGRHGPLPQVGGTERHTRTVEPAAVLASVSAPRRRARRSVRVGAGAMLALTATVAFCPSGAPASAVPAKPVVLLGMPYAATDPLQVVDIYPAASPGAPLVMLVHGEAWQSDSTSTKHLAARAKQLQAAGFATFVVNYRSDSASVAAFPMEVDDVVAATSWAVAAASTYNADPSRVTLIGGSAGSTLVGLAAERMNESAPGTVGTVITLSGAQDFLLFKDLNAPRVGGAQRSRARALGCSAAVPCTAEWEARWSPARQVTSANCPAAWLALNSAQETTPLAQAQALVGSLRAAGCDATLQVRAGSAHGFGYWHSEWPTIEAFILDGATDPLYEEVLAGTQILSGALVPVRSHTEG